MKVSFNVLDKIYTYEQTTSEEEKLNCLLTSVKGDFLNLGIKCNSTKFQGYYFCNSVGFEYYKILDELVVENYLVTEVEYSIDSYKRVLISKKDSKKQASDSFLMTPTGDVIYKITNCDSNVFLDFDCHKFQDLDVWGRNYTFERVNDLIILKFEKRKNEKEEYSVYVGIKTFGGTLNILNEWHEKEYFYSHYRCSDFKRFVFRFASFKLSSTSSNSLGKIFFSTAKSRDDVIESLDALSKHENNIENYMQNVKKGMIKISNFKTPLSQETDICYKLIQHSLYSFVVNSIEKEKLHEGILAGYPWFVQIWNRDELVSLKAYMNQGEDDFVKKRLDYYFLMLDPNTGLLRRLQTQDSEASVDGVFWLAKRFEEFIIHLDKKNKLEGFYGSKDLKKICSAFKLSFEKIIENLWDTNEELLKVKDGDSWMDTIHVDYPLDIQVQFIGFLSSISSLASICGNVEDAQKYLDFEYLFKAKIRSLYFRHGCLFDEPYNDRITVNVFLAYYVCPELFEHGDWEYIFDKTLNHLKTSWGGLSSLSKRDSRFIEEYTGENNKSYHNGDSWYFMNHIVALALSKISEKKYRDVIQGIIKASTNDILKLGTIGFCSEISSAKEQRAEGCFAQAWSSATFIELIDSLYEKHE